ncbi:33892_t:CDS:2, partial [Racocetra persica]
MIEIVEDKGEIIKNSINCIWRATSKKAAAIIFNNDPLLSATLIFNDGMSNTVNLDAPSCVIQAENINLDRQPSDLSLEIEMDIQENTAQNTES